MDNKSISPIMAVVILVGVAIGGAALFYAWFSGIQSGTQEVGGATAGQTALATAAAMKIDKVKDYTGTSNGTVVIKNIGSVNLTNIQCTNNDAACTGTIASLAPGKKSETINCTLSEGVVNVIECTSDEGATASYNKLK